MLQKFNNIQVSLVFSTFMSCYPTSVADKTVGIQGDL